MDKYIGIVTARDRERKQDNMKTSKAKSSKAKKLKKENWNFLPHQLEALKALKR